jgi:hypothetical protein
MTEAILVRRMVAHEAHATRNGRWAKTHPT